MISDFVTSALGGSMLLAIPVAVVAGLVSFFSPCVVPLLPGYLTYATGLGASEVVEGRGSKTKLLVGTSLFVLGISVVFVATGALAGSLGAALLTHRRALSVAIGAMAVLMGFAFAGWLPIGRREFRLQWTHRFGLAAAPLLGMVFALGWTPCIGPTLAVVLSLSLNEGSALRGGVLAFFYSLGLGLPFVLAGLAFTKMARLIGWMKAHQRGVLRVGGIVLVVVGVLLMTGWWDAGMSSVRQWAASFGALL